MVLLSSWLDCGRNSRTCGSHFCGQDREVHRMVECLDQALPRESCDMSQYISFWLRPIWVGFLSSLVMRKSR